MKPETTHDSSDHEPVLDELFKIQELAPKDFAARTIKAVRTRRRHARMRRFTAWTGAIAASITLLLGLSQRQPTAEPAFAADGDTPVAEVAAANELALASADDSNLTSEELTALLYAALSEQNSTVFYGHARDVELLLEEAIALADAEQLHTLDMLILFAHH